MQLSEALNIINSKTVSNTAYLTEIDPRKVRLPLVYRGPSEIQLF
jgi:hypothetical protein